MELTYDSIVKYMTEYFETFNAYGQNPDTIHRMDKYFAPDFEFIPSVSQPQQGEKWDGETGLITEVIDRNLKNASECEAYLCGSPGMIDAVIKVLKKLGTSEDNIFYDKFA